MSADRPSVDSKSFELAEHFLSDEPNVTLDDKWALADDIQNAVEAFFAHREHAVTVAAEGDAETCAACDGSGESGARYLDGSPQPCGECRGNGTSPSSSGAPNA